MRESAIINAIAARIKEATPGYDFTYGINCLDFNVDNFISLRFTDVSTKTRTLASPVPIGHSGALHIVIQGSQTVSADNHEYYYLRQFASAVEKEIQTWANVELKCTNFELNTDGEIIYVPGTENGMTFFISDCVITNGILNVGESADSRQLLSINAMITYY